MNIQQKVSALGNSIFQPQSKQPNTLSKYVVSITCQQQGLRNTSCLTDVTTLLFLNHIPGFVEVKVKHNKDDLEKGMNSVFIAVQDWMTSSWTMWIIWKLSQNLYVKSVQSQSKLFGQNLTRCWQSRYRYIGIVQCEWALNNRCQWYSDVTSWFKYSGYLEEWPFFLSIEEC